MTPFEFESEYDLRRDGEAFLCLALTANLFWPTDDEHACNSVLQLVRSFWNSVHPKLSVFQTASMKKPKKLESKSRKLVDELLSSSRKEQSDILIADARTSSSGASPLGMRWAFAPHRGVGYCALSLPPTSDTEAFAKLLIEGIRDTNFFFGFAGFGLVYNDLGELATAAEKRLFALGMRHVGLDLPCVSNTSFAAASGIKCVNWLTFLGQPILGKATFDPAQIPKQLELIRLSKGIAIRAGEMPCIGDVNCDNFCEDYRAAGRLLAPWRAQDHPAFVLDEKLPMASRDRTDQWLSRFDN
jgi:hypothetical protein